MDPMSSVSSLPLKPNATSFEHFQYWLARKVVLENFSILSSFLKGIASVFQRVLPYFSEMKTKMEAAVIQQLQVKTISQVEIDRSKEKTDLPPVSRTEPAKGTSPASSPMPGSSTSRIDGTPPCEPSQVPKTEEERLAQELAAKKIKSLVERAASNVDTAASLALSNLMERGHTAEIRDISSPVRKGWNMLAKLWKTPKEEDPIEVESRELQEAIEGQDPQSLIQWFEKQIAGINQDISKARQGKEGEDQASYKQAQYKMAKLRLLLNSELPNQKLPLHYAFSLGKIEPVKLLLANGVELITKNADDIVTLRKDRQGNTALDCAAIYENPEISNLIKEKFKEFFISNFFIAIQSAQSKGIPLSAGLLQKLEVELNESMVKLLGKSSEEIADPLAISTNDQIRFAALLSILVSIAAARGLIAMKWEEGHLATWVNGFIRLAGGTGYLFEGYESTGQLMNLITGLTSVNIPQVAYMLLSAISKDIPPLRALHTLLTYVAVGGWAADSFFVLAQNYKKRPWDAAKKVVVLAANCFTRWTNFFVQFSPEGQAMEKMFKMERLVTYLQTKVQNSEIIEGMKNTIADAIPLDKNYAENHKSLGLIASEHVCKNDPASIQRAFLKVAEVVYSQKNALFTLNAYLDYLCPESREYSLAKS